MEYRILESDGVATLALVNQLVVTDRQDFDQVVDETFERNPKKVVVDLRDLAYMDSAGLGLLLMLRDTAKMRHGSITLLGASGQVQELFETAGFEILFDSE